jgi:chemotaxis protein MotB
MRIRRFLVISALGLLSTGCVNQDKYNAMRLERDSLRERVMEQERQVASSEAKAASYKLQADQMMTNGTGATALVANLQQQNSNLQAQLSDITSKYNDALNRIGQGSPLPAGLTNELTTFADQNPDLVEFDAKRGTVKFKSDLTFASGDAQLTPSAVSVIERFSKILNSPSAAGYELMVCGHADNQKVSAPTASRGHKDNWYLSAHRALSVAEALQKQGIAPKRIGAVGYGEYRPIADNGTKAGMALNRRVEVLILPTQITEAQQAAAAPATEKPAVEIKRNDESMNK